MKILPPFKYPKIATNAMFGKRIKNLREGSRDLIILDPKIAVHTWKPLKKSHNFYYVFPICNSKLQYMCCTSNLVCTLPLMSHQYKKSKNPTQ